MSQTFIDNRLFHRLPQPKERVGWGCTLVVRWSGKRGYIEVHSIEGAGATFRVVLIGSNR